MTSILFCLISQEFYWIIESYKSGQIREDGQKQTD